ncbi:hypothetical protein BC629DRAFT_1442660 [Irpex lacteus]|nr:hypothetical protein BC629DRAFT_1442660 [Irpex lacteus]
MSSSVADISGLMDTIIQDRLITATTALYSYEWIITFNQEIEQIWNRKWNLSTWIFAFNRYSTFVFALVAVLPDPSSTSVLYDLHKQSCVAGLVITETSSLLSYVSAAGLRTSALCNRSLWMFLIVFGLALVPFFTTLVIYAKETIIYVASPAMTCGNSEPFTDRQWLGYAVLCIYLTSAKPTTNEPYIALAHSHRMSLAARLGVMAADVIALGVSWRKALSVVREASRHHINIPLGRMLTLPYSSSGIFALNVYQLVSDNLTAVIEEDIGTSLINIISPILQNRFMLNLRQAAYGTSPNSESSAGHQTTIFFNSEILIGNLGESLDLGDDEDRAQEEGTIDSHLLAGEHHDIEASGSLATPDEDLSVSWSENEATDVTEVDSPMHRRLIV